MGLDDRIKYAAMKARHPKLFLPWYKKWWGILILIVSGLIFVGLIASGIYVYNEVKRLQVEQADNALKDQRQAYLNLISGPGNGYSTGSLNPKITIIEFTDFACPFCKESAPVIRKLLTDYKDSVKLVVRDYPIHDNSIDLALAARCAGDQGKYWEAYDSLFANQDNLTDTGDVLKTNLLAWAGILKLDQTKFETCFNNRTYVDVIKKDYDDGNELKIQGTPTWFVNNYAITGYYAEDKFKELFDGILQQIK
jgi:protein-disulfide isomerase